MVESKGDNTTGPQAFLSYAHHDDKFLRGAIRYLREDLEDAIHFVTGEPFKIFLDADGIEFGQHWPQRLSDELRSATFLIPILSPNYFHSEACRKEALEFMKYESSLGRNDLILPIYLADTKFVDETEAIVADELANKLSRRQYRDYRDLVFDDRASSRRSLFIKNMASEIEKANIRLGQKKQSKSKGERKNNKNICDPVIVEQALEESKALISFSRRKMFVGKDIADIMRKFWIFLSKMYVSDKGDCAPDLIFIWVIDVGSRLSEQPFSFDEYFNAGLLALQVQTFLKFDSLNDYDEASRSRLFPRIHTAHPIHRSKRWRWLNERSVVVVQNLRPEEYQDLHPNFGALKTNPRLRDIGVSSEQILPTKTPTEWEEQMLQLYGRKVDASDATFTVFLSQNELPESEHSPRLRYFAHTGATPSEPPQSNAHFLDFEGTTQSVELSSPGRNYDDAFQLLYEAARCRLHSGEGELADDGIAALAYVEKLDFQVLTLSDYLRVFSRVFELDDRSGNP